MARETPLTAIRACRHIERLPDGSKVPPGLAHTLLVLASYYPNIFPGQYRLAADLKVNRRNVNKRLRILADAGLIVRTRRGWLSTSYELNLSLIRRCVGSDLNVGSLRTQEVQHNNVNDADNEGVVDDNGYDDDEDEDIHW